MLPLLNGPPLSITNAVFAREIHPQGNGARGLVAVCGVKPQKPEGEQEQKQDPRRLQIRLLKDRG
jgi:hypothetical protein